MGGGAVTVHGTWTVCTCCVNLTFGVPNLGTPPNACVEGPFDRWSVKTWMKCYRGGQAMDFAP